jgi:predicted DNA binding CopG/RHH family protein
MDLITSWQDIPQFTCEHDEAKYWLNHRLDAKLMAQSLAGSDQSESTTISMRIDPRMLSKIKRLARSRYLNYQSMLKQWISERLEQEVRDRGGR